MKILIVRFSSIGDVVLTTPIVRCVKNQVKDCEIHYLTKRPFAQILSNNPHIAKIHVIDHSINEVIQVLKAEKFDFLVDLHNNIRTLSLKRKLGVSNAAFPKLNIAKWILVNFKWNRLPQHHIVERYFEAVKSLKVTNDLQPCEYYLSPADLVDTEATFFLAPSSYIALAIGAQFASKRMPASKLIEICNQVNKPIILVGGKDDAEVAREVIQASTNTQLINACGKLSLGQSASVVKQAAVIITNDTGMMHIASAFEIPTVSVWGSTVPALGMYPYFPQQEQAFSVHEVMNLSCRPCSKIGFQACPKKHFSCMMKQDSTAIASDAVQRFEKKQEFFGI